MTSKVCKVLGVKHKNIPRENWWVCYRQDAYRKQSSPLRRYATPFPVSSQICLVNIAPVMETIQGATSEEVVGLVF